MERSTGRRLFHLLFVFLVVKALHADEWNAVGPGVDYQRFLSASSDIHVARIDLTNREIRVVGTPESSRGTTVGEFAKSVRALVAINGDYFDAKLQPIGLAIGPCGQWEGTRDTKREGVAAFGTGRALIQRQSLVMDPPDEWIEAAVSGWPMIISSCEAYSAARLPGSDAFTRSPHPRTAVGLSANGKRLFLVVADGRRENVPGLTLAQLARFMRETLGVCTAINLDGGGSSAMWVDGRVVNAPSDGAERRVSNHLAVVLDSDRPRCDREDPPLTPVSGNAQPKTGIERPRARD